MGRKKNLLVGVGNYLLGDEGVGIHVVHHLQKCPLPNHVEILDGGTMGLPLLNYFRDRKKVILVDAIKIDTHPGAMFRFPLQEGYLKMPLAGSAHQLGLPELFYWYRKLDPMPAIIIYGIVPDHVNRFSLQLSVRVQDHLPGIISLILKELQNSR